MREIIELFIAEGEPRIAALHAALQTRNAPSLQREAHTIKGSGRDLGAMRLVEVCQKLEDVGRDSAFDRAPDLIAAVVEEFGRARTELEDCLLDGV